MRICVAWRRIAQADSHRPLRTRQAGPTTASRAPAEASILRATTYMDSIGVSPASSRARAHAAVVLRSDGSVPLPRTPPATRRRRGGTVGAARRGPSGRAARCTALPPPGAWLRPLLSRNAARLRVWIVRRECGFCSGRESPRWHAGVRPGSPPRSPVTFARPAAMPAPSRRGLSLPPEIAPGKLRGWSLARPWQRRREQFCPPVEPGLMRPSLRRGFCSSAPRGGRGGSLVRGAPGSLAENEYMNGAAFHRSTGTVLCSCPRWLESNRPCAYRAGFGAPMIFLPGPVVVSSAPLRSCLAGYPFGKR